MDRDTLGYSVQKGSRNLKELASGDYPVYGVLV